MIASDKGIFDAFRLLTGPISNSEVRSIKKAIKALNRSGEDHELFHVLGEIDDDDTISNYEFETLKQAIVSYKNQASVSGSYDPDKVVPYVSPDLGRYGSELEKMLTMRVMLELLSHEAIVLEAYRDSRRIWTWGMGIATTSGFRVRQYKDKPQSIETVLKAAIQMIRTKYAPAVLKAFEGHTLTEPEFAAALSFHYNTGAILRAEWVKSFMRGNVTKAHSEFTNWRKPPEILERRKKERDLFFHGIFTHTGKTTIYPVRKPGYSPNWSGARRVDIQTELKQALV